jgi:hypothetical protein
MMLDPRSTFLMAFQMTNSQFIGCLFDGFKTVRKRQMGIRHLKRHQKRRARVQHRLIQELKKIAKTFRIFLALQICFVR